MATTSLEIAAGQLGFSRPQISAKRRRRIFKTDPGLVPALSGGMEIPDLFWLDGPLIFVGSQCTITIPANFVTDLASIPKVLDWIPFLDREGLSRRPGALHDGIYNLGRERGKDWADAVLREACLSEGMSALEATLYFKGVQWFGGGPWAKDAHVSTYGLVSGKNFVNQAAYDAWRKSGATIYSSA